MTPKTTHERSTRRAQIVRRWAAYRVGRAQREIWKRRHAAAAEIDEAAGVPEDLLAELPDGLLG
jgi:hypothetical protein